MGIKKLKKNYSLNTVEKVLWIIKTRIRNHHEEWENLNQDSWVAILDSLRKGKFDPENGGSLKSYIYIYIYME